MKTRPTNRKAVPIGHYI